MRSNSLAPPHSSGGQPRARDRRLGTLLTHTAGDRVVPLCQGIGHGLAVERRGTLKQVSRVALESDDGAGRKLRTNSPSVSGLGDRAALGVTGTRNS